MDIIYSVHPLAHSWSRDGERRQAGSFFAHDLSSSPIDLVFAWEDYAFRRTLVPRIKVANQHDALLGTLMASDGERWTNYGPVFFEVGYWKEGGQLEVPVMETEKRVLGKEHPDMLRSMANLVSTCWNQGRWKRRRAAGCGDDKGGPW